MIRKNAFFEGWSWFRFNNLGLALGKNLKFYTSVAKGLKLKVRKFWGTNFYVCRSYRGKLLGEGAFCRPPTPTLNRVNGSSCPNKVLKICQKSALFLAQSSHCLLYFTVTEALLKKHVYILPVSEIHSLHVF